MIAPSLISIRRFQAPVRHRLTLALAAAWEALAETHQRQAVDFIRALRGRLEAEEALQRYFREVAVPALMQETVRARTLLAVAADLVPSEAVGHDAIPFFRVDHLLDNLRRRALAVEEQNLAVRLAAAVADEAITTTHVANSLTAAEVLSESLPLDEALAFYIRAFDLPSVQAQVVFQRGLAQLARRAATPAGEALAPPQAMADPAPRLPRASRMSGAFGLRAIG
jgi:hypothetical protein